MKNRRQVAERFAQLQHEAWEQYSKAIAPARKRFEEATAAEREVYEAARAEAWAEYLKTVEHNHRITEEMLLNPESEEGGNEDVVEEKH